MNIELWHGEGSGVLRTASLLLKCCRANAFGTHADYPGGSVDSALFTYLSGAPDAAFFAAHPELFFGQYLVCMSGEWERFLRAQPSLDTVLARRMEVVVLIAISLFLLFNQKSRGGVFRPGTSSGVT